MKPPAFPLYAQDLLVGGALMSNEEFGIYVRLLCYQWTHQGLPCDQKSLCGLVGSRRKISVAVLGKFKVCEDGKIRNERMELERVKQDAYRESRAENGRKGGRPEKPHGKHMVSVCETIGQSEKKPFSLQSSSSIEDREPPLTPKPSAMPKTLAEAIAMGRTGGVPDSFTKEVFLEHEGTAWTFAGKPINNFSPYLSSRWMRVRSGQAERQARYEGAKKVADIAPTAPKRSAEPPPPWMAQIAEIRALMPVSAANRVRLRELAKVLPRAAWGLLDPFTEFNPLNALLKDPAP
jgi:uncharacterized protein YdaU (DUF1376 family)